jgi:hypothetical protein
MNQPEIEENRSFAEDEEEDELFFMLTRNPYLIVIRKALTHIYPKKNFLVERLRGLLELYLI